MWFFDDKEPEPVINSVSYRAELREFIEKNAPLDFNEKMAKTRPFLFTSFIAWPMFWMYRGMDWSNRSQVNRSLVSYINRTFHQAKLMQIAIIGAGLLFATYEESSFLHAINNVLTHDEEHEVRGDW